MAFVKFPDGFLFGADISDYQHSGGLICDLPLIDADKHSTYYEEDFKILKELGLNALRTGVEWARIEPEEGKIDQKAIGYYHRYLSKLKETGVTTIIDLYHIGNPRWIHKHGGWASKEIVEKFLQHVDLATSEYDQYIDYYQIINEPPFAAAVADALQGQKFSKEKFAACLNNVNDTIKRSYDIIHEKNDEAMVGVANPLGMSAKVNEPGISATEQKSEDALQTFFQELMDEIEGQGLETSKGIDAQEGKFDYIGINYYGLSVSTPRYSAIIVYPEGLRELCKTLWEKYRKPIIITENGLPNRDDDQKTTFLVLHLKSVNDAITQDGANVIGYCWWSFLPSWEFGMGMPNFGLVDVDTLGDYRRIVTQTALDYSEIIKNQGFPMRLYERCHARRSSIRYEDWI